ncbi:MAG: UDP-N-acetylglucosamine 1-carboxyvinyltransferase [Clostridia bacterium]|nr:UDP-N-acetylglucosamine 1-carboxyvinyltransferase [Clostridia bacterium]
MEKIIVNGGNRLNGEICISGMKNSALPIIFSCILVKGDCIINNVPKVSDVFNALEILSSMGAVAEFCGKNTVLINTDRIDDTISAKHLVSTMRASSYLMGAMLSRFGKVKMPMPGGCNFGARPIDLHLKGFEALGAKCFCDGENVEIFSSKKLKCNKITLDKISVGATINMVLASACLNGTTVISNCAKEPHVDDLIAFLNCCGAKIARNGTTVVCQGVKALYGKEYTVFPDMIEALTYICAVGICKGEILLKRVVPYQLSYPTEVFKEMGFEITACGDTVTVRADEIFGCDVVTAPYPLFPTDLHPQFAALLCFSRGGGCIREEIFPTRFAYVNELRKMGASISRLRNMVYIKEAQLTGASLDATDLRAGASLVLAALGAAGESEINNVNYIVRGYESIVEKIADIGGKIKLIKGD